MEATGLYGTDAGVAQKSKLNSPFAYTGLPSPMEGYAGSPEAASTPITNEPAVMMVPFNQSVAQVAPAPGLGTVSSMSQPAGMPYENRDYYKDYNNTPPGSSAYASTLILVADNSVAHVQHCVLCCCFLGMWAPCWISACFCGNCRKPCG